MCDWFVREVHCRSDPGVEDQNCAAQVDSSGGAGIVVVVYQLLSAAPKVSTGEEPNPLSKTSVLIVLEHSTFSHYVYC